MSQQKYIALRCRITRSGFPDERVFRVQTAEKSEYAGVAPRLYCFTEDGVVLEEDQPRRGEALQGLIAARPLREEGDRLLVSVPDGGVFWVGESQVTAFPSGAESSVPV